MCHQLPPGDLYPFTNFDIPHLHQRQAEARGDHPFLIWEPFEVTAAVPGVAECALVAKRDPMLGEVPVVFVLPPAGFAADAAQLSADVLAKCQVALADFKVRREVRVVDELLRATLDKIANAKTS